MSIDTTKEPLEAAGPRVCDPDTGWDRFSVIQALTLAARREREAKIDQLILIARAAEVWSWIDNIDEIVDQTKVADRIADADTRGQIRAAAEAGDDDLLDALLTPRTDLVASEASVGASPGVLYGERRIGMARMARRTRAAGLAQNLCLELDRRISPYAPGWTPNRILTQTDKLIVILDPDTAEARRKKELGRRYVSFWADRHPSGAGMLNLRAQLDAVPAADLEATLNALAEILEAVRPDLDADARRARGLELLADPAHAARVLAGDLTGLTPPTDLDTDDHQPARELNPTSGIDDAADPATPLSGPGLGPRDAVEAFVKPGSPAAADLMRRGCGCGAASSGRVPTGREVSLIVHVNPADLILGAGGETPRLGHLVQTLLDQLIAEAAHTGPTTDPNLGPLDRLPHRWKTHTTCQLTQIRPGTFTWHTPAGQTFTVTPHGTYPTDPGPDWPTPPPARTPKQQAADLLTRARQAFTRAHQPQPSRPSRTTGRLSNGEPSGEQRPNEQGKPPDAEPPPF